MTIPLDGRNKADFTIAARQSFSCPNCLQAINLPREVLVKLAFNGYAESPVHQSFQCKRCGSEVNISAEW